MRKLYEKNELTFSLVWIGIYVVLLSAAENLSDVLTKNAAAAALCRDGEGKAAVISALTFGIGHIVNLLNGAELVPTLLQIVYAVAVGFVFVALFIRSGSIVPCVLTHGVLNALWSRTTKHNASSPLSSLLFRYPMPRISCGVRRR